MSILSRFHAKYAVNGDGCWILTASKLKIGYGIFTDTNRGSISAHKWSYLHFNGAIPDGFVIDHICRQTSCVNPAHLQAITQSENIKRKSRSLKNSQTLKNIQYYFFVFILRTFLLSIILIVFLLLFFRNICFYSYYMSHSR
jgi:hypothetical protein